MHASFPWKYYECATIWLSWACLLIIRTIELKTPKLRFCPFQSLPWSSKRADSFKILVDAPKTNFIKITSTPDWKNEIIANRSWSFVSQQECSFLAVVEQKCFRNMAIYVWMVPTKPTRSWAMWIKHDAGSGFDSQKVLTGITSW